MKIKIITRDPKRWLAKANPSMRSYHIRCIQTCNHIYNLENLEFSIYEPHKKIWHNYHNNETWTMEELDFSDSYVILDLPNITKKEAAVVSLINDLHPAPKCIFYTRKNKLSDYDLDLIRKLKDLKFKSSDYLYSIETRENAAKLFDAIFEYDKSHDKGGCA